MKKQSDKQRIYKLERSVRALEGMLKVLEAVVQYEREQRQGIRSDFKNHGSAVVELIREYIRNHEVQNHPQEIG